MGEFQHISVPHDSIELQTDIRGLRFSPNHHDVVGTSSTQKKIKIISNTGTMGGHFVTHGPNFKYNTFGVHVGQIDKLTFVSVEKRIIEGYFIDCRYNSPTAGNKICLKFLDGIHRKIIIPCGVAHSFKNLENVVTRNDLELLADNNNPDWNLLNDNIVFDWTK